MLKATLRSFLAHKGRLLLSALAVLLSVAFVAGSLIFSDTVSRTFEGRDRFAPAAGWLAKGVSLASLGRAVQDYQRLDLPGPTLTADGLTGRIVSIDRFGNCITDIDRRMLEKAAGTTVTQDVPPNGLAIGRAAQVNRPDWAAKRRMLAEGGKAVNGVRPSLSGSESTPRRTKSQASKSQASKSVKRR